MRDLRFSKSRRSSPQTVIAVVTKIAKILCLWGSCRARQRQRFLLRPLPPRARGSGEHRVSISPSIVRSLSLRTKLMRRCESCFLTRLRKSNLIEMWSISEGETLAKSNKMLMLHSWRSRKRPGPICLILDYCVKIQLALRSQHKRRRKRESLSSLKILWLKQLESLRQGLFSKRLSMMSFSKKSGRLLLMLRFLK